VNKLVGLISLRFYWLVNHASCIVRRKRRRVFKVSSLVLVLLMIVLATVLIFSRGVFAQAVKIGFSGPYTEEQVREMGIDPEAVPSVWICEWHSINWGIETLPPEGSPSGTKAWLFHADEDLPDFEFYGGLDTPLEPGNMDPYYIQWTHYKPDGTYSPYYLHFSGGQGIPYCTYFDLYAELGGLPPSLINFHATPIPSTLLLLGSGFIGLIGFKKKLFRG